MGKRPKGRNVMQSLKVSVGVIAAAAVAASAGAAIVHVQVEGVVDFNVIQGNQAGTPSGAPVHMGFNLDSNVFQNSASFPTRGYPIDLASFSLVVNGNPINIINPQPGGATPYFVLRDNDPAVDGFFISTNTDVFAPWSVTVPGLTPVHDLNYHTTFANGSELSSLNILDAVGTHDLSNISVYEWSVGRFGNNGAEYAYQTITISVVPAPGAAAVLLAPVGLLARRRRA